MRRTMLVVVALAASLVLATTVAAGRIHSTVLADSESAAQAEVETKNPA